MARQKPLPPIEIVRREFSYNAETGELVPVKKRRNWNGMPSGRYGAVTLGTTRYSIARVCWYLATGVDPGEMEVDHINRDKCDNRLANLRLATRSQQSANRGKTSKLSLPKGVSISPGRGDYYACWGKDGKGFRVSGFSTKEEAHLFYLWNTRHHGEFADELPISACPPRPSSKRMDKRRSGCEDLPKGVSRVRRRRANGEVYFDGFQTSFVGPSGKYTSKKGFKTAEDAYAYYMTNRRASPSVTED